MKKFFTRVGNLFFWILTLLCLLMTWGCLEMGSKVGTALFGIAAAMLIPMNPFRYIRREWLNIKTVKALLLAVVLFFAGMFAFPAELLTSNDTYLNVREQLETVIDPAIIEQAEGYLDPAELLEVDRLVDKLPLSGEGGADETLLPSTFSVTYIDVGQGDAALVECDGKYMLIDGGTSGNSNRIYSILNARGATHLDILVASHAHEDHIGGLSGALNYATVGMALCPKTEYDSDVFRNMLKYLEQQSVSITVPKVGDSYKLGSAKVEILAVNSDDDENETSIILKVTYGNTSFLFTGDGENAAEQMALRKGNKLGATVLKVGHHGADTSSSEAFIKKVNPEYAVISVGKNNSYGHPTAEALGALKAVGAVLYRTDMQGDITAVSDGDTVTFTTARNTDADTYGAAGAQPTPTPAPTPTPTPTSAPTPTPTPTPTYNSGGYSANYILNVNTEKFHYPSCSSVKKMKESNKIYFDGSRDEAIRRGYDPCGICHP